jgi:hypothetical protein
MAESHHGASASCSAACRRVRLGGRLLRVPKSRSSCAIALDTLYELAVTGKLAAEPLYLALEVAQPGVREQVERSG